MGRGILVDTGAIVALVNARDPDHDRCVEAWKQVDARPLTVEGVLVEAAFVLRGVRGGIRAAVELLDAADAEFIPCERRIRQRAMSLIERYHARRMDLVDAFLVACAEERRVFDILTLDVRDFSIYRPLGTRRFTLYPSPR